MAGVEIHGAQLVLGFGGHARGGHEIQRVLNAVGHFTVLGGLFVVGEAERPGMHPVHIGEPARGKGAQQVERGRSLRIGL